MISFDAATVFVAWATGCLAWQAAISTRREVVFGAAWVIRVAALLFAAAAIVAAVLRGWASAAAVATVVLVAVTVVAVTLSIVDHRRAKASGAFDTGHPDAATPRADRLDRLAVVAGTVAVIVGALDTGGPATLAIARYVVGAAALGGLTFTLVFGHRMLAKSYLGRGPLELATTVLLVTWPLEILVMLIPTGMVSILDGAIDDGYAGILGWMWAMCAVATGVLVVFARVILADREHSKAASATGMLYLSGLCGVGAVLISRAVLSG